LLTFGKFALNNATYVGLSKKFRQAFGSNYGQLLLTTAALLYYYVIDCVFFVLFEETWMAKK